MRKKIGLLLILIMILLSAVPASAKAKDPVGEKLNLFAGGAKNFDAGAPFHVAHGFAFSPPDDLPGPNFDFTLAVDGDPVDQDFKSRGHLTWLWVFNFPDGMTGSHTFVARWYAPCRSVSTEPCENNNAPMLMHETTTVVTFTP
jgi:hypothetical protein